VSYGRVCLVVLALLCAMALTGMARADEWRPVSPEELKMTEYAKAPGAPAIILYRQVDRDDSNPHVPHEYNYVREKIFTEEGRKYADVDIPIVKGRWNIVNIRARTIHPDGSIVDFDGKVYEKEIVKARGFKYLAKTFTFSDVQPGSVIEYHYMIDFAEGYVFDSHWIVSDDLFTKFAKFTLKPYTEWPVQWAWPNGLPQGAKPPVNEANTVHMEINDIPAFLVEDDMPPEGAMRFLVDFVYSEEGFESDKDKFWKKQSKKMTDKAESFLNKRKAMEDAVGEIVSGGDSMDAKLQKIYARVQKIRNKGYEVEKTEQEQKRAKEKAPGNVEDVWKWGYGDGDDITLLFVGLARAAGFEASAARVATRDDHFFYQNNMKARDLNTYAAVVKVNEKDIYFDPGSLYVPYGMLPWSETDAQGLKLTKDGPAWITTPLPPSADSQVVRKAELNLTNEGSLEGKLTVTFTGLEASGRRVAERNEDDTAKKKMLEDYVKENIPAGIEVELKNKPDWTNSAAPLVAEYELKVPGWMSGAGKRALCPVGLFSAQEKHMYEHSTRVHPLYFQFPYEKTDDVHIELPLGWQVGSLPQIQDADGKIISYTMKVENDKGGVHVQRHLRSQIEMLEAKYYTALRNFYQAVRTGDEQQVVLQPGAAAASN
jgi:hypothetical protein